MSLYGNNEALLSPVGARVDAGQIVAQAGASGGGQETGVYFEIRIQGEAVDPALWIARIIRQQLRSNRAAETAVLAKQAQRIIDNRAAEYRHTEWLRAMRVIATRRGKHG